MATITLEKAVAKVRALLKEPALRDWFAELHCIDECMTWLLMLPDGEVPILLDAMREGKKGPVGHAWDSVSWRYLVFDHLCKARKRTLKEATKNGDRNDDGRTLGPA